MRRAFKILMLITVCLIVVFFSYRHIIPAILKDSDLLIITKDKLPELGEPFDGLTFSFMHERPYLASGLYIQYRDISVSGIRYRVYLGYTSILEAIMQDFAITYGSHVHLIKTCDPKFVSPSGVRYGESADEIKRTSTEEPGFFGTPIGDGWIVQFSGKEKTAQCFVKRGY